MIPQMSSVFFNWSEAVQLKVIHKTPVDFEVQEDVLAVPTVEMVLNAMSPRKIDRKPEGERSWKWWDGWTTTRVQRDTVLQDPNGLQFRVGSTTDWEQAGFFHCELYQQPDDL